MRMRPRFGFSMWNHGTVRDPALQQVHAGCVPSKVILALFLPTLAHSLSMLLVGLAEGLTMLGNGALP